MKWSVNYYQKDDTSPVEVWLLSIDSTARAKILRNIELLKDYGLELKMPYVRSLGNKLFEVRAKDSKGIYRLLYFAHTGKQFVMLHGFTKKSQKAPPRELEIAMNRMKEIIDG